MHPIIQRLKERKIIQWALAYLAGAGVLYSTLDGPLSVWGITVGQLKIAQVVVVIGLFAVVVLAWYHGERGEQRVSGVELMILAGVMGLGALGIRLVTTGPAALSTAGTPQVQRQSLTELAPNHAFLGDFEFGPQGTGFTYALRVDGGPKWYRRWDELVGRPIVGSLGGNSHVSPDGRLLAETSRGRQLRLLSLEDGGVQEKDMEIWGGVMWGGDGYLYFPGPDSTIHRIAESLDGPVEPVGLERGPGERMHRYFQLVGGGDRAVFWTDGESQRIDGYDLRSKRRVALVEGVTPLVTSTGHLVYVSVDGRIMAATLDTDQLTVGTPVPVIEGEAAREGSGGLGISWSLSSDGTLGYWEGKRAHELLWVTRSGASTPVDPRWSFDAGANAQGWALSPDQRRIVFRAAVGGDVGMFVRDIATSSDTRLTPPDSSVSTYPRFLSDTVVVFSSGPEGGSSDVYAARVDGVGSPSLIYDARSVGRVVPSPNGEWLLIRTTPDRDIVVVRTAGGEEMPDVLANPDYREHGPSISPDGRWLAYSSDELGHDDVSVRPFPNVDGPRTIISSGGGMSPFWSYDGKELFFLTLDRRLMAVRVSVDPTFRMLSQAEELFVVGPEYVGSSAVQFGHATRDGRFLMMRSVVEGSVVIVNNWFEELNRRVPN
jgi:eukaryotic-like serine/threonine-protein kinase